MLRSAWSAGSIFILLALTWALYDPLASLLDVANLRRGDRRVDAERALLRRGRGAVWALRHGQDSGDPLSRLRCSYLLAMLGDPEGDRHILAMLHEGERRGESALAQQLMLSIWNHRQAPPDSERALALRRTEELEENLLAAREKELNLLLPRHPAWVGGWMARAELRFKANDVRAAVQDAVAALALEPEHFEAMVLLGRCFLLLDCPEWGVECLERALQINPRLKREIEEELNLARTEAGLERERRRIEKRRELPLG